MTREELVSRVEDLLSRMTVEEKVAQMIQVPYPHVGREEALRWASIGAGSFLHVLGDEAREVQQVACASRLGIPVLFGIDAVRGHALNDHATIFPTQLACACTWNRDIAYDMGRVTGREVATDGLHWTFSPLLCLARDTRWGRVNETFGEDPYLTGELAAAIIKGYQGESLDDPESILACAKHYLAYGEATGGRDSVDSEITYRKVREVFLPPFKKAVEAGCGSFMTAYGSTDGLPITADPHLLKDILRDELGFDGFVITDWDNVRSLMTTQHLASDFEEASVLAANAGNDMIMTTVEFFESTVKSIRSGALSMSVVDNAVRHILTVKFRMGLFERPEKTGRPGCFGCREHQEKALEAARRSITLLKNDHAVLPIGSKTHKIVLVGKNGDDIRAQYGDWTYFSHPLPDPDHEPVRPYTTLREGLAAMAEDAGIDFEYVCGCGPILSDCDDLDAAVSACANADLIIHAVGDEISQIGEQKDRANLALTGRQNELFLRLAALKKPLVSVLISSKPLTIVDMAEKADAVLVAFNGGAHGGQALAEAIFGRINPSGRLPISFPYHSGQLPVYYNQLPGWHCRNWLAGEDKGYFDLPFGPLYAFGEGLSYTDFEYRGFTFDPKTMEASVLVLNNGAVSARETVQVYFNDIVSSILTPVKQLIAWKQIDLMPGEEKQVHFTLNREDFSLVNRKEERVIEPGTFELMIGHSSREKDLLKLTFEL